MCGWCHTPSSGAPKITGVGGSLSHSSISCVLCARVCSRNLDSVSVCVYVCGNELLIMFIMTMCCCDKWRQIISPANAKPQEMWCCSFASSQYLPDVVASSKSEVNQIVNVFMCVCMWLCLKPFSSAINTYGWSIETTRYRADTTPGHWSALRECEIVWVMPSFKSISRRLYAYHS